MSNSVILKLAHLLKHPRLLFARIMYYTPYLWSDEFVIRYKFRNSLGYSLNLKDPKTYNEKLQWLKLYDRNPKYTIMVDKYAAKKYVENIIGSQYIIPTIGIWDNPEDIIWDQLPDKFVLKATHDSGGIVICKDKETLNKNKAIKVLKKSLNSSFYYHNREWPYKDVPRKIIAEKYIESNQSNGDLPDYKFFCFDGVVKAMFIATDRSKGKLATRFDFFDENFNHLPFTNGHPNAEIMPTKPLMFEEMKVLASKLSKGVPQLRVDFYEVNGQIYFGELTFFHWSGLKPFVPEEWDYKFGEWIKLPHNQ